MVAEELVEAAWLERMVRLLEPEWMSPYLELECSPNHPAKMVKKEKLRERVSLREGSVPLFEMGCLP
jgi:hypothetical protein